MLKVKRLMLALVIFSFALATLVFVLENQQDIAISFLGWRTAEWPSAVLIALALIIGMLIGPLFCVLFRGARRGGASSRK